MESEHHNHCGEDNNPQDQELNGDSPIDHLDVDIVNDSFNDEQSGYEDEDEFSDCSCHGDNIDVVTISEEQISARFRHLEELTFPETVKVVSTEQGSKVFIVGTAHFSIESQDDVAMVIRETQPDIVMLELCSSRINILQLDEEMLLKEAQDINFVKIKAAIKESGLVQGLLHLLLLSMSAHLTKQLGMAPGGEFRRAYQEANKIDGCRIHLGDRPIQVTLRRALGSLSLYHKMRLAWYMITSKDPISKEDVEKCKQKDLLEEMLKEMTGDFPALSRVFVEERDIFLANSLQQAAKPIRYAGCERGFLPKVVVGVVGIGHTAGIISNWEKQHDISLIMTVPQPSRLAVVTRWAIRLSLLAVIALGGYRIMQWTRYKLF